MLRRARTEMSISCKSFDKSWSFTHAARSPLRADSPSRRALALLATSTARCSAHRGVWCACVHRDHGLTRARRDQSQRALVRVATECEPERNRALRVGRFGAARTVRALPAKPSRRAPIVARGVSFFLDRGGSALPQALNIGEKIAVFSAKAQQTKI